MNALVEFLNACLEIEITKAYSELREHQDKREDILKRLNALQSLRVKLNCFEGTGEVISESSSSSESSSEEKHEEEEEKHEEESTSSSSSDSLTKPPEPMKKPLPPFPGTPKSAKRIEIESSDSDDSSSEDFGKYRKTPFVVLRPILEQKEKGLYFKFWRLWNNIMNLKKFISRQLKIAMGKAYEVVFDRLNAKSETIKDFKRNINEAYDLLRDIYNQMEDDYEDPDFKKKLQQQRKAFTKLRDEVEKL